MADSAKSPGGNMSVRTAALTDDDVQNASASERFTSTQIKEHLGKYALFVQGRVEAFFDSNKEALLAALEKHAFGEFSVLRVGPRPGDAG